jgi:Matrixin
MDERSRVDSLRLSARIVAVVLSLGVAFSGTRSANADARVFDINGDVAIRINWQSFLDAGFPAAWEGAVLDTVIAAYTRWIHVGGMKLRPKFQGTTTRTAADPNEILVMANQQHSGWFDSGGNSCTAGSPGCTCNDCSRLASRFGSGNRVLIVIHRRSAYTGSPWPHAFWRTTDAAQIDNRGILLHELGHAFGLEHEDSSEAIMYPYQEWWHSYGPNSKDIADIVALYGKQDAWRAQVRRTVDNGVTYAPITTNLTGLGVTTTLPPTASRDSARTIFFYTSQDHRPSWIIGNPDGNAFDTASWFTFGGLPSVYGTAGHGYGDEYMMAWADHSTDQDTVNVVRSVDGGRSYFWANPPASRTMGTPGIHKVADNTWVLAYSKLGDNATGRSVTGKIITRVTTNDGATWGPEVELNGLYRAENGVSITSNGPGEIRIGFSWAISNFGTNYYKRTMVAHLDAASNLVFDRMIYENETSRTQPVMAKAAGAFLQAWREPNYATSINTRNSLAGSSSWDNYFRAVETSPVVPAAAAFRDWSFGFLYTIQ